MNPTDTPKALPIAPPREGTIADAGGGRPWLAPDSHQ